MNCWMLLQELHATMPGVHAPWGQRVGRRRQTHSEQHHARQPVSAGCREQQRGQRRASRAHCRGGGAQEGHMLQGGRRARRASQERGGGDGEERKRGVAGRAVVVRLSFVLRCSSMRQRISVSIRWLPNLIWNYAMACPAMRLPGCPPAAASTRGSSAAAARSAAAQHAIIAAMAGISCACAAGADQAAGGARRRASFNLGWRRGLRRPQQLEDSLAGLPVCWIERDQNVSLRFAQPVHWATLAKMRLAQSRPSEPPSPFSRIGCGFGVDHSQNGRLHCCFCGRRGQARGGPRPGRPEAPRGRLRRLQGRPRAEEAGHLRPGRGPAPGRRAGRWQAMGAVWARSRLARAPRDPHSARSDSPGLPRPANRLQGSGSRAVTVCAKKSGEPRLPRPRASTPCLNCQRPATPRAWYLIAQRRARRHPAPRPPDFCWACSCIRLTLLFLQPILVLRSGRPDQG